MKYFYLLIPETSPLNYFLLPPALIKPELPTWGSKSIFAYWHSGINTLPPYLRRNVLGWYRRFAPLGWAVHVLDAVPGSPLNVSQYIDTSSPAIVPVAYTNNTIESEYAHQHGSDLVRFPLLLKYGGAYMDIDILLFGDLDGLWRDALMNPGSPYELSGFKMEGAADPSIVNFAIACGPDNPLLARAHLILFKMWEDRTHTAGMHRHPLVSGIPLMRVPTNTKCNSGGMDAIDDATMTDYAIQIEAMRAAQQSVSPSEGWDGPRYVREQAWLFGMLDGANTPEQLTGWNGNRLFELLSLEMPQRLDERETDDQNLAREIVQRTVAASWCYKLSHGFTARLFGGDTVGMLWRKHVGSDNSPGTYAGWLRWAMVSCRQDEIVTPIEL